MSKPLEVTVSDGSEETTVEGVASIERDQGELYLETASGEKTFGEDWLIDSVEVPSIEVREGDWIKYLDDDMIKEGEVMEVYDDEVSVKTAPDGWMQSISKTQMLLKL